MSDLINQALNNFESSPMSEFLDTIAALPSDAKKPALNKIAKQFAVEVGLVKHIHNYFHAEDLSMPLPTAAERVIPLTRLAIIIKAAITKYISCSEIESKALTLWILQTWFVDYVERVPYLIINSPEPECGKSQLLKLLQLCTRKSCYMPSVTSAIIPRVLTGNTSPTLLIDETDTNIKAMYGAADIINDGYERGGRSFKADLNDQKKVVQYETFSNKAFAGIDIVHKLKSTVLTRSIVIRLKHIEVRDDQEIVQDLSLNKDKEDWERLRSHLRKAELEFGELFQKMYHYSHSKLHCPKGIKSLRQRNIWKGIFVIANLAKTIDKDDLLLKWAQECISELTKLKIGSDEHKDRLCSNIKEIVSATKEDFLPTMEIVNLLNENEDWGWKCERGGAGLSPDAVARFFATYDLKSERKRSIDKKGFYVNKLKKALSIS